LTAGGYTSKMSRKGDEFFITTMGPDNKEHTYKAKYRIGSVWKQRYVTELPNGALNILPVQWNIKSQEWVDYHGLKKYKPGSGGYVYVGTDQFCGYTCHQMKTRAYIWQKSSHNDVKCITCHSEPGFIVEFKAHIDGLAYLKSFVKGKTTHLTVYAEGGNAARLKACIHCHPAEELSNETEAIRINHEAHIIREELLCTDCHKDMAHGTHSFEVKMEQPKEGSCISCHMRQGTRTDCQSCHIKKVIRGQRQVYVLDALHDTGHDTGAGHLISRRR
jgi:hypothetical protein